MRVSAMRGGAAPRGGSADGGGYIVTSTPSVGAVRRWVVINVACYCVSAVRVGGGESEWSVSDGANRMGESDGACQMGLVGWSVSDEASWMERVAEGACRGWSVRCPMDMEREKALVSVLV